MGAKKARAHKRSNPNFDNVVDFNVKQKKTQVNILPRNRNQETYVLSLLNQQKDIVFGIGPAGTGKTLLAVQVAVKLFKEGAIDKIIVTRPAVSVDEDLGFLPGTLEDKMAPWTRPIFDVLRDYFNAREIEGMIAEGIIEIAPLAYMRGRTFKNSFIIADEMQNSTAEQMKMLLTRTGSGSFLTVTGDGNQHDRGFEKNGLQDFVNKIAGQKIKGISLVQFERKHVERDPIVETVLELYGEE